MIIMRILEKMIVILKCIPYVVALFAMAFLVYYLSILFIGGIILSGGHLQI